MVNCHPKVNLYIYIYIYMYIYIYICMFFQGRFGLLINKKIKKYNPMPHAKKACIRDSIAFERHVWWHTEVNNELPWYGQVYLGGPSLPQQHVQHSKLWYEKKWLSFFSSSFSVHLSFHVWHFKTSNHPLNFLFPSYFTFVLLINILIFKMVYRIGIAFSISSTFNFLSIKFDSHYFDCCLFVLHDFLN